MYWYNHVMCCTKCRNYICLNCAKLVAGKELTGASERVRCPMCNQEPTRSGVALFVDYNPSTTKDAIKNQPVNHYWDKTPAASLAIDAETTVQLQPARTRSIVGNALKPPKAERRSIGIEEKLNDNDYSNIADISLKQDQATQSSNQFVVVNAK